MCFSLMLKKLENSFNLKTSMTYLTWMKQTECSKSNKKGKQRNGEHLKICWKSQKLIVKVPVRQFLWKVYQCSPNQIFTSRQTTFENSQDITIKWAPIKWLNCWGTNRVRHCHIFFFNIILFWYTQSMKYFFVNICRPSPTFHKFNLAIKMLS